MARILKMAWAAVLALFALAAVAQPVPEGHSQQPFSQAELDQMLAPIALYPDSLLSHVLAAAANPRDVVEAAAWLRTHQDLRGEAAVDAARHERWDPSVVSLTAFPEVLALMEERRYWTEKLGEAFVEQPRQVMDTVQQLRARADAAGNLQSGEQLVVERRDHDYVIEPASPEIVYVPYYDPRHVYGPWWWADYPPVYWGPWSGYRYVAGYPFGWGYGVRLGSAFWLGAFDWPRRYLRYSHYRPWYYSGRDWRRGDRWTHDRYRYWASRDGRWRDSHRSGDGRTWTGDRPRTYSSTPDGRWQGRDGRTWEGRDGRNPPREQREVLRNPVSRPVAPALTTEGAPRMMRQRVAPTREQRVAPAPVQQQSAPNPAARAAPAPAPVRTERSAPAERSRENPAARGERSNRTLER
jgi:hypothetical protein